MEKQGKRSTNNEQAIVLLKKIMLGDITREFGIQNGLSSKGLHSCREQFLAVASYPESSTKLDSSSGVSVGEREDALVDVGPNKIYADDIEIKQEGPLVDVDPKRISADDLEIKEEPYNEKDPSYEDQDNQVAKVKEEASAEGNSHHGDAASNVMNLDGQEETIDDYRGINSDGADQKLDINNARDGLLPTSKGEERFSCSKCSYSTNMKCNLRKHLKTHDVKGNNFACSFCPYKTHLKSHLTRHLPTHDPNVEKNLLCGICPYKTFCPERLNEHLKRHDPVHSTRLSCSKCPYKTGMKAHLARHCLTHAQDQSKQLACPHCHYRTDGKGYLERHLKIRHQSITGNSSTD